MLRLPAEFRTFRDQTFENFQQETERRFQRVEEQIAALTKAQRRTEERLEQLAEAQRRTQEEIQQLTRSQQQMQATLDRFAQIIGAAAEERLIPALRQWVEDQRATLVGPIVSMSLNGIDEVDGAARIRWPEGREGWVLVSVKAKVNPRDIREFQQRILENTRAREALWARGISDPVWPMVFGLTLDERAVEAAADAKIGLLISQQGMIVSPIPLVPRAEPSRFRMRARPAQDGEFGGPPAIARSRPNRPRR
ncbi:hypothetical protein HRbin36_01225 [bacterium HR36]|nr:hypothetical protein HRbin36_01225 [bacterium HR36]